jgi:hypothetical protein
MAKYRHVVSFNYLEWQRDAWEEMQWWAGDMTAALDAAGEVAARRASDPLDGERGPLAVDGFVHTRRIMDAVGLVRDTLRQLCAGAETTCGDMVARLEECLGIYLYSEAVSAQDIGVDP